MQPLLWAIRGYPGVGSRLTRAGILGAIGLRVRLPPHFCIDIVGQVAVVRRPDFCREVLPASVGEQEDDVAVVDALGILLGRAQYSARRDAGKDAVFEE